MSFIRTWGVTGAGRRSLRQFAGVLPQSRPNPAKGPVRAGGARAFQRALRARDAYPPPFDPAVPVDPSEPPLASAPLLEFGALKPAAEVPGSGATGVP